VHAATRTENALVVLPVDLIGDAESHWRQGWSTGEILSWAKRKDYVAGVGRP